MPELPDVEGFKRVLAKNVLCKTIARVVVSDARILGKISARTFASRLQNAKLVAARRHGKHLMANIDHGGWLTLPTQEAVTLYNRLRDREPVAGLFHTTC